MTHEQKIRYMEIATSIVGFKFRQQDMDMIVSLYDLVLEKEGETDLESVCKLQFEVEQKYSNIVGRAYPTEETNS